MIVARGHALELPDQVLRAGVLDVGLVHQRVIVDRLADRGVEDFFFDLRVDRQLVADLLDQLCLLLVGVLLLDELVEFLEQRLDGFVIGGQQRDGVLFLFTGVGGCAGFRIPGCHRYLSVAMDVTLVRGSGCRACARPGESMNAGAGARNASPNLGALYASGGCKRVGSTPIAA